jgi:capsular exopolysaccharide synthesis family protein
VCLGEVERPSVIITSALAGEGKTATCGQLAWSMAYAGQRVVVIDLDLRHPTVHLALGAHNDFGVTDVLLDKRPLADCVQYVEVARSGGTHGLYLLAAGPSVSNPTELLGSRRTSVLIEAMRRQADIVLIDSAPVLPVADTLVVGPAVSGAILVVEAHRTATDTAQQAKNALIRNQTRLFGMVLNKVQANKGGQGYGYGYGYGYGPDTRPEDAALESAVKGLVVEGDSVASGESVPSTRQPEPI